MSYKNIVVGEQITDDAVSNAKTAEVATATIKGRATAGTGDVEDLSKSQALTLLNVEDGADVTDATNVAAAGAVMEGDTSTALMSFVIDEDTMVSDSATKIPTQQSVKAYVDAASAAEMSYKGGYNASTNSPDLDTTPIATAIGDMYTVTAAGTFFTTALQIGDVLIAETLNATTEAEWTILERNLDTATATTQGIVELATVAEVDTGTDTSRVITPAGLAGSALQTKVDGIEALADVTDATNVDAAGATMNTDSTLVGNTYFLDEDTLSSDDATKVASQQSIKAYVDNSVSGLLNLSLVSKVFGDSPYTTANYEVVVANATGGAMTVNLPVGALNDVIMVKKTDSSANLVSVKGNGVEKIDDLGTQDLTIQYEAITCMHDGSNWHIV